MPWDRRRYRLPLRIILSLSGFFRVRARKRRRAPSVVTCVTADAPSDRESYKSLRHAPLTGVSAPELKHRIAWDNNSTDLKTKSALRHPSTPDPRPQANKKATRAGGGNRMTTSAVILASTLNPSQQEQGQRDLQEQGFTWHRAAFAGGYPPTIIAAAAFHNRVRDGSEWDHSAMDTRIDLDPQVSPENCIGDCQLSLS